MRATKFSIETFGNRVFEGFTLDEDFNGWDCPYFTFDQAKKVLEAQQQIGTKASYNEQDDSFIFNIDSDDAPEIYSPLEIDGQKFYPIGTFNWIWEEIK